jgi:sugar phosphate isomerase/epimerase
MGFAGVEFGGAAGELEARRLTESARRHLLHVVKGCGLEVLALTADPPGARWTDPKSVHERVERACDVIGLARSVRVPVVSAHAGALVHPDSGDPSPMVLEALAQVGERADACGVTFAIHPSNEKLEGICRVLDALRCPAITVALDPAALIMSGSNPMSFLEAFATQLPLLYLRDGTVGGSDRVGSETAFGRGDVDWEGILAVLDAVNYAGPIMARCVSLPDPLNALVQARQAFTALLQRES